MALKDQVQEAGVVGAGGAGFPTHVKVGARAEVLIANGAECEPVLATDQWVTAQHPVEVLDAMRAVAQSLGARRAVLAVKKKYRALIERVSPLLKGTPDVELFLLDDFYPAGDEQVLVHEVTGRVVPEGGLPLEVGAVVQNVATLKNIHDAMHGRPVIEKHVTVAGEVARPGVYIAPLGTSAAEVIAAAGGATRPDFHVIEGGPMMGFPVLDLAQPVTKTTSGYLVLPPGHPVWVRRSMQRTHEMQRALATCCGCRMCTDLCPRALLGHRIRPHMAMRAVQADANIAGGAIEEAFLCCQCGVCEAYACPMGLSPRRVYGAFKERLARDKVRNPYHARPQAALDEQRWVRVPKHRLTERLGLEPYLLPPIGTPQPVPAPWEVRIPLHQHIGVPAAPVVARGDRVAAGQPVGIPPEGSLGARVHASIDGVVTWVDGGHVRIERAHP